MTITIRQTTAHDISAFQSIARETGLFPPEMLSDLLAPFLEDGSSTLWLTCEDAGQPIGLCYLTAEELAQGTWNMLALAILPDRQGEGLGGKLVQVAEAHLRERDVRLLIVDTSGTEEFAMTRRFYAQCDYEEEARIRDFWSDGDDKITFRKRLT